MPETVVPLLPPSLCPFAPPCPPCVPLVPPYTLLHHPCTSCAPLYPLAPLLHHPCTPCAHLHPHAPSVGPCTPCAHLQPLWVLAPLVPLLHPIVSLYLKYRDIPRSKMTGNKLSLENVLLSCLKASNVKSPNRIDGLFSFMSSI